MDQAGHMRLWETAVGVIAVIVGGVVGGWAGGLLAALFAGLLLYGLDHFFISERNRRIIAEGKARTAENELEVLQETWIREAGEQSAKIRTLWGTLEVLYRDRRKDGYPPSLGEAIDGAKWCDNQDDLRRDDIPLMEFAESIYEPSAGGSVELIIGSSLHPRLFRAIDNVRGELTTYFNECGYRAKRSERFRYWIDGGSMETRYPTLKLLTYLELALKKHISKGTPTVSNSDFAELGRRWAKQNGDLN